MPEEMNAAQETDLNASETDNDADIGQNNDGVNDADFSDTDGSNNAAKPTQDNSANARRRREAERKAELDKARQTAREQAIIETLGGKNPYTNEDMKDSTDVEEYLLMKEIEKNGGDPLSDYSKHLKAKQRESAEKLSQETADKEWYRNDREAFAKKYPDVDIGELIHDEQFIDYSNGKVGEMPLTQIYEGYAKMLEKLKADAERSANTKAQQQLANAKASPGSLASTNANDSGYFTREQVQAMTKEEVHKNYDKIRASMAKWK